MIVEMTMKRVAGGRQWRAVRRAGDIAVEGLHHSEDEPGHGIWASAWVVCERQGPFDILPRGARRNWEGDQAKHGGGACKQILTAEAPSPALRMVPLPRAAHGPPPPLRGGGKRVVPSLAASQFPSGRRRRVRGSCGRGPRCPSRLRALRSRAPRCARKGPPRLTMTRQGRGV